MTICDLFKVAPSARRACGLLGGIRQLRCFRGRAARTLQKALRQKLEMWMKNGKSNKIKEHFKAEMSTTDHTLLPGSPAVHLVSLCLICGHLWCALSLSSHLVSPCAPAASTGHHSRTFSPHARCQATGLACRRRRCREAASQSPPQVAICISINLKCAI